MQSTTLGRVHLLFLNLKRCCPSSIINTFKICVKMLTSLAEKYTTSHFRRQYTNLGGREKMILVQGK